MNRTHENMDWQTNWQEENDLPDEVRRRTLARIYLMAIIILGMMFAMMGLQFTMLNDSTMTYVETEGDRVTISFVPPDELDATQTTTENKESISHETQETPVSVEQGT